MEGPQRVGAACEDALAALSGAFEQGPVSGSRAEWAAVIGAAQRVVNVATAVQDAAMARLAGIEVEWLEDGTEVERDRGPGHVALDAPAIVSGELAVSAVHAERRMVEAVRLAGDDPEDSEAGGVGSGLGGLHQAMRHGRLDAYRASVVADELAEAPPQVAACVVAAVEGHFGTEDGAHLRRRCRRVLARISPDLLVERAKRARAACGLRRWVAEPGVDRWEGTFPSEDAARAWAAVDALAQRYVRDGTCTHIERARGKALTDLVAGNATIDAVVTLTVPVTALPAPEDQSTEPGGSAVATKTGGEGDLVEVTGLAGTQPVLVSRRWLTATVEELRTAHPARVTGAPCHPLTGALVDIGHPGALPGDTGWPLPAVAPVRADRYRPSSGLATRVRARDRRCRFPGCAVAAVFCDLDHVRPWPAGATGMGNLVCLCRRHHRIKQRPGWRVALAADGTVAWTDPTGRERSTAPIDALTPTVLRDNEIDPDTSGRTSLGGTSPPSSVVTTDMSATAATGSVPVGALPDGPHSSVEYRLEHLAATAPPTSTIAWRDERGAHRVEVTPVRHDVRVRRRRPVPGHQLPTSRPGRRPGPGRGPVPRADHDTPPF